MSRGELVVVKEVLEENISVDFICQSLSPFPAPVMFINKPGRGIQFCIIYYDIYSKTVKNRCPLPLIQE
jgi:hypothetical protein